MRRALMWLNLYGREAVRHKLKNGLKTPKMYSAKSRQDPSLAGLTYHDGPAYQSVFTFSRPVSILELYIQLSNVVPMTDLTKLKTPQLAL